MGKSRVNADFVRKQRVLRRKASVNETVKRNPFETKFNKRKFEVVGQKIAKNEHGMPGVSRSKSLHKRQNAILSELKTHRKVNRITDRRIGERDKNMSVEDKMFERFAREQKKHHERSQKFNLDDDDDGIVLTHRGQNLRDVEQFNDAIDSDDPDDTGIIEGEQQEGHFGGGEDADPENKSFKERMEEIITKSKVAKMEKKTEKEELVQLTSELDDEFKLIHNSITRNKRQDEDEHAVDPKAVTDYDKMIGILTFEPRGTPSDRIKTEAELAKIEKEKLDKLEEERIQRMRGIQKSTLQSADDLEDGMDYGGIIRYDKDGNLIVKNSKDKPEEDEENEENEMGMEEMMDGSDDDEGDDYRAGSEGESSDSNDQYSDLDSNEESEEDEEPTVDKLKTSKETSEAESTADSELPYTFKVPDDYAKLVTLLNPYTPSQQNTVLDRMRKCHHVSLRPENKALLQNLFGLLLEYFGDACMQTLPNKELINIIMLHLRDISNQFPTPTSQTFKLLIMKRYGMFAEFCKQKKGKGVWPFLDTLLYLRVAAMLYPTSDFRHEVVTPAMLFISDIYTSCSTTNHRDIAVGLLLSTIVVEYTSFSKAVFPECLNFLTTLLMSADKTVAADKVVSGTSVCKSKLLVSQSKLTTLRSQPVQPFNLTQVVSLGVDNSIYNTDPFIISALYLATALLLRLTDFYRELSSASALLKPAREALDRLKLKKYPEKLKDLLEELKADLCQKLGPNQLSFVSKAKRRPKMIRLYEPLFEDLSFNPKRKPKGLLSQAEERQKLLNRVKKEKKSAAREIRRDRAIVTTERISKNIKESAERKRKTNQVMALLQAEQHEMNEVKKSKEMLNFRDRKFVRKHKK